MGTGGSFWDLVYYQGLGSSTMRGQGGAYGIRGYNPNGLLQQNELKRAAYKSYMNTYSTLTYHVKEHERQVLAYATQSGNLNIMWGEYSDVFEEIAYARILDVVKLAQAYLMEHLARAASILTDSAMEMSINSEALKADAADLRGKVKELWEAFPNVIYLHNS
jgi:hypothetical protein